jgi:hypothetical protein
MPIVAPKPGFNFLVVDYLPDLTQVTGPAGASGVLDALFDPVDTPYYWLVDRITLATDSLTATVAVVYVGDAAERNVRDATSSGNADVADESAPIVVPTGGQLRVRWIGASVGAVGTVNVQARVVQRQGASA